MFRTIVFMSSANENDYYSFISPMTYLAFQLVGLITSYAFNFDGLIRSCVN